MKKRIVTSALVMIQMLMLAFAPSGELLANEENEEVVIGSVQVTIAADAPGSSWHAFSETFSTLLKSKLPKDATFTIISEGNGLTNPTLLTSRKATLALSYAATALWAFNGMAPMYGGAKHDGLRALAGGLSSVWFTALIHEGYIQRTGHATLEQAISSKKPVRIITTHSGTLAPILMDGVLASLGSSREKIKANGGEILLVEPGALAEVLGANKADVYFETAEINDPKLNAVLEKAKLRFVDLPKKALAALKAKGLIPGILPKSYKGQKGPIQAADLGVVLLATESLPDDLAELFTSTLLESSAEFAKAHPAYGLFKKENSAKKALTGVPLHGGVMTYYRMEGWLE